MLRIITWLQQILIQAQSQALHHISALWHGLVVKPYTQANVGERDTQIN